MFTKLSPLTENGLAESPESSTAGAAIPPIAELDDEPELGVEVEVAADVVAETETAAVAFWPLAEEVLVATAAALVLVAVFTKPGPSETARAAAAAASQS